MFNDDDWIIHVNSKTLPNLCFPTTRPTARSFHFLRFLFLHNSYTIIKYRAFLTSSHRLSPFFLYQNFPSENFLFTGDVSGDSSKKRFFSLFFPHSSDSYKARKIARLVLICSWSVAAIAQVEMLCLPSSNWLRRWNFLIRKRCHLWRIAQRLSDDGNFRFAVYMIEREIEFPKIVNWTLKVPFPGACAFSPSTRAIWWALINCFPWLNILRKLSNCVYVAAPSKRS